MTLFAGFASAVVGEVSFRYDPAIPVPVLSRVAAALGKARGRLGQLLDWSAEAAPPPLVLYRDDQQLRSVACINQAAIGYYDGSIHVSVDAGHTSRHVEETVVHEYTHHALTTLGVRGPTWLHEGLAMVAASERWFESPQLGLRRWIAGGALPFLALVPAFPHTAEEQQAAALYFQSFAMVDFLRSRGDPELFRRLTRDLASGAVTPAEAFGRAAGLAPAALAAEFQRFVTTHLHPEPRHGRQ